MKFFLPAALILIVVAIPLALFLRSSQPSLKVPVPPKVIGKETQLKIHVESPHGVRRLTAAIEQNGQSYIVSDSQEPAVRFSLWRAGQAPRDLTLAVGQKQAPALKEGKAKLTLSVEANDLRALDATEQFDVEIVLAPPRVTADSMQHYINQGGAELVVFQVTGYWTEAGVKLGPNRFRSFPLPGSKSGERFSLFVFPWDLPASTEPVVYATNPGGSVATAKFWSKIFPKKFRSRDLDIGDSFLEKVVNQIDAGGAGDLLARFLKINGELRRENNRTLADLRLKTEEKVLWNGPFLQLANSKVESQFADRRSYIYKGKKVDEQVHLGFDLSVTKNVDVAAANDGKVVYAGDFGIYGNCVVLDHGYGLQSVYAHLSGVGVKPGDMVKKGGAVGKSGSTGLAGGDHLHFTMQIDGVQTNPVEWWDDHWIKDRIRSKLPGA